MARNKDEIKAQRIEKAIELLKENKVNELDVCSRMNLIYMLGGVIENLCKQLNVILKPAGGFKHKDKYDFGQLQLFANKVKTTTLYQLQDEEAKQDYLSMVNFLTNLSLDSVIRVKDQEDMLKISSTIKNYFKPKFK